MALQVDIRRKAFQKNGNSTSILQDVHFSVEPGKIACLYGPSGCGKSTLLRIIAGLDSDYEGEILLEGHIVTEPSRDIGMTVQAQVAFDWLSVAENIAFGLRYMDGGGKRHIPRRLWGAVSKKQMRQEAERVADLVGLSHKDLEKYPSEISGGMKQRMAFARALLPNPKVLLLDEPFSALDYESRSALQDVVLAARDQLSTSFVCVSHDPEEVLYLADEVIVLLGLPAKVQHRVQPSFIRQVKEDIRYTQDFQGAKRYLRGLLIQE